MAQRKKNVFLTQNRTEEKVLDQTNVYAVREFGKRRCRKKKWSAKKAPSSRIRPLPPHHTQTNTHRWRLLTAGLGAIGHHYRIYGTYHSLVEVVPQKKIHTHFAHPIIILYRPFARSLAVTHLARYSTWPAKKIRTQSKKQQHDCNNSSPEATQRRT